MADSSSPPPPEHRPSNPSRVGNRRLLVSLVVVTVAVAVTIGGIVWIRTPDAPSDEEPLPMPGRERVADPRIGYDSPYQNIQPGVAYVGDAACAACHVEIDRHYHAHPMGQSAAWLTGPDAKPSTMEQFDSAHRSRFTTQGFDLVAKRTQSGMTHQLEAIDGDGKPLPAYSATVHLAIGSGTRGRSYLTLEPMDASTLADAKRVAVWQSPLSWFTSNRQWDISPGFDLSKGGRRPTTAECLYCHVDLVDPIPDRFNQFSAPLLVRQSQIGCERCHGPGEKHVAEAGLTPKVSHRGMSFDPSIVNPKHLPPTLRSAICQQCHLQGEELVLRRGRQLHEFRPGMPFEWFATVFTRHPEYADSSRSVGQFEQMHQSRCFTQSAGQLDCLSCHDPHQKHIGDAGIAHYRQQCLTCHQSQGCSTPLPDRQAKADNCLACHMPRGDSSNIAHASVTDHRILRKPQADAPKRSLVLRPELLPLQAFLKTAETPADAEIDRDLGIAMSRLSESIPPSQREIRSRIARLAAERLTTAVGRWPGDDAAWMALSVAENAIRPGVKMLEAAERAAALAPESESAWKLLAEASLANEKWDRAELAANRLVEISPRSIDHWLTKSQVHLQQRDWSAALAASERSLAIQPLFPQALLFRAVAQHHLGQRAESERDSGHAFRLTHDPALRAAYRDWFRRQIR
ncbi:tetratricopeptide repeat protein [Tuwongella immobilis]|uniref:Uncharacterized protein n=1 Tax=Tuwongella immobilis TaxID=692036 RepID=A0A6C2YS25_9BACT|nr:tetratricopeptide repeat protein [Tuwongella immobilis]VIP04154.1 tpr repeat-containing protein : Uncharacterized protein OS=Phaeodactylibacter xiamenensis GN=IX84_30745 PE=4 SV=1: Cytochrome_C554: TPR_9 [Tuwongella immobilis]VTS05673.1 tpr repeat-containing protein : Uncharacterized protein OS=Phaeodactylibacter xiamenensis GN=IX84_30745 PE=4 SV=1: Cytochrome_C554: TPR_9 [Tuwongella immobilis]